MYFNLRKPYMDSILSSFLVRYWARRLYMESPQTVPKDTLGKQNTPPNLSIIVFYGTFSPKWYRCTTYQKKVP